MSQSGPTRAETPTSARWRVFGPDVLAANLADDRNVFGSESDDERLVFTTSRKVAPAAASAV
jgi:hypothetical protein